MATTEDNKVKSCGGHFYFSLLGRFYLLQFMPSGKRRGPGKVTSVILTLYALES